NEGSKCAEACSGRETPNPPPWGMQQWDQRVSHYSSSAFHKETGIFQTCAVVGGKVQEATALCNRLRKNIPQHDSERVLRVLETWRCKKPSSLWMSYTLPLDLNLPMDVDKPEGARLQMLFACEDLPFVLLTLCDSSRVQHNKAGACKEAVKRFTVVMAQLLTSSLFNFCQCDFILVPCVLEWEKFSEKSLDEEVKRQLSGFGRFYSGPERLTSSTLAELCAGVEAVAGVSYVPALFEKSDTTHRWLLLLKDDWRDSVSLLIEKLVEKDFGEPLIYTAESEFKVQVAMLEAAKRLSYSRRVTIVTSKTDLHSRVMGLVQVIEEEEEMKISLGVSAEMTSIPDAQCLIYVDRPLSTKDHTSLCLRKGAEEFRFLLLGKTGTGRSTTGNTLLDQKRFKCEESICFSSVTRTCNVESNKFHDKEITVMDSPGLFDTEKHNSVVFTLVNKAATMQPGFDAIIYTLKIGSRFTTGDFAVYERLRAVFGEEATRYMIIVFTHGDELNGANIEDELKTASQQLKTVLSECGNRYVVFNNVAADKKPQVDTFLEKVREMRVDNDGQPFQCPPYNTSSVEQNAAEVSRRLEQVWQMEKEREKLKRG
ncbi:hypothetical protein BaRGS_00017617, partial [Batillaria attramentaria]